MTDRELAGCALLPCPFCGGEAKRDDRTEYQSYSASESQSMGMSVSAGGFSSTTYAIQCGCGIRVQGNNDAFLIERWNRRAPSSEGDGRDGAARWEARFWMMIDMGTPEYDDIEWRWDDGGKTFDSPVEAVDWAIEYNKQCIADAAIAAAERGGVPDLP